MSRPSAPISAWSRVARGRAAALAAAVGALTAPTIARAQEACDQVDGGGGPPATFGQLQDFFPSDNATNVPTDGFVRLRYEGRPPARVVVRVRDVTAGGELVPGAVHVLGAEVHWQSDAPLAANHEFEVAAPDLVGGAGDSSFTFTTGLGPGSAAAPTFDGLVSASFVRNGASDLCGDPDAVEVTVTWRPARDNGWPDSDLEYVIFQTRGPGIGGPVERARERGRVTGSACGNGGDEQCRAFRLAARNAVGQVCFNVQAVDAYGRADGNGVERCVNPAVGNYFQGCAARPGAGTRQTPAGLGAALACLLAVGGASAAARRRRG